MKYSKLVGILAGLIMIASCFAPWAYYPDIDKNFTGLFSQGNSYGKPGLALIFFGVIAIILFVVSKIWAKRCNLLVTAVMVAYSIKTFILYTSCYGGVCPLKKPGIYLMLSASVIMLIMSMLPDIKVTDNSHMSQPADKDQ